MGFATRCTACNTVFRVVQDQLRVSDGWVRCGRCHEVFNAQETLFVLEAAPAAAAADGAASAASAGSSAITDGAGSPAAIAPAPDAARAGPAPADVHGAAQPPAAELTLPSAAASEASRPESDLDPGADGRPEAQPAAVAPGADAAPAEPPPAAQTLDAAPPAAAAPPAEPPAEPPPGAASPAVAQPVAALPAPAPPAAAAPLAAAPLATAPLATAPLAAAPLAAAAAPALAAAAARAPAWPAPAGDDLARAGDDTPASRLAARDRVDFEDARFDSELFADEAGEGLAGTPAEAPAPPSEDDASADDGDAAQPEFVRRAERNARWNRPAVVAAMVLVCGVLLLGLAAQAGYHYRDLAAASYPHARPALLALCEVAGCRIEPVRRIEDIVIDSSTLTDAPSGDAMRLSVVLRNRGTLPLAMPAIELALTDAAGQMLARRALLPAEFGKPGATLAAGTEAPLQIVLAVDGRRPSGYTVEPFYP